MADYLMNAHVCGDRAPSSMENLEEEHTSVHAPLAIMLTWDELTSLSDLLEDSTVALNRDASRAVHAIFQAAFQAPQV